ncbi:MAG: LPP20 family lipoprotein [Treponema sp.]|nr:LPP20 family lipoprotein [Treponema sp.]
MVYNRSLYIAAVGSSQDRITAERNALANLSAFFGQSVQADTLTRNTYYEAARSGAMTKWLENTEIENVIRTSVSFNTLIGAEIKEVWHHAKNKIYYAAAVMERQRTIQLYTSMITANLRMINNLVNLNDAEKYSIEGLSRYRFAGMAADINIAYANLLNVLNAPLPNGVIGGNDYRLEARNISGSIPIIIIAPNDRENRISGAFAKVLSDYGFRIAAAGIGAEISGAESGAARGGDVNSRYTLYIKIALSQPEYPQNPLVFAQIQLSANLTDNVTGEIILPYGFSVRDGHNTAPLAENRAFISAEQRINTEYRKTLDDFLNQLF